jgi:hypothetical protein
MKTKLILGSLVGSLAISLLSPLSSDSINNINNIYQIQQDRNNILIAHSGHEEMEVPKGQPIPTLKLIVTPAQKGWNLELKTTNFKFLPEKTKTKSMSTAEGHAHLFINGKKITRIYSSTYFIDSLPKGNHKITVSLSTVNHADITVNDKKIEDTKMIVSK